MEQDIILLYAKPYEMDTDDRGRVRGISVRYLLTGSLDPVADSNSGTFGVQVAKGSLDYAQLVNIIRAPALYRGLFSMQANAQGKVELKLISLTFLSDLSGVIE